MRPVEAFVREIMVVEKEEKALNERERSGRKRMSCTDSHEDADLGKAYTRLA